MNTKYISLVLAVSFPLFAHQVFSQTYNSQTGVLNLPNVTVDGAEYGDVTIKLDSFQVLSVGSSPRPTTTPKNGICGSSNSSSLLSAPETNLCTDGTSSQVTGTGPWYWSCNGSDGGETATCFANVQPAPVSGACGAANGTNLSSAPASNLCSAGTAGAISGNGPWNWSCQGNNGGTNANCSASKAVINDMSDLVGSFSQTARVKLSGSACYYYNLGSGSLSITYNATLNSSTLTIIGYTPYDTCTYRINKKSGDAQTGYTFEGTAVCQSARNLTIPVSGTIKNSGSKYTGTISGYLTGCTQTADL